MIAFKEKSVGEIHHDVRSLPPEHKALILDEIVERIPEGELKGVVEKAARGYLAKTAGKNTVKIIMGLGILGLGCLFDRGYIDDIMRFGGALYAAFNGVDLLFDFVKAYPYIRRK